jgi:hypothetical protein
MEIKPCMPTVLHFWRICTTICISWILTFFLHCLPCFRQLSWESVLDVVRTTRMGMLSHCFFKQFKIPFWKKPTTAYHYKDQNPVLKSGCIGYAFVCQMQKGRVGNNGRHVRDSWYMGFVLVCCERQDNCKQERAVDAEQTQRYAFCGWHASESGCIVYAFCCRETPDCIQEGSDAQSMSLCLARHQKAS